MVIDNTRRIIVIKEVDSEYVQEAILILRDAKKGSKDTISERKEAAHDFLVKEAQRIIDSYVSESKLKAGERRSKYLKSAVRKIPVSGIIYSLLFLGVALAVFLISRIF